VEPVGFNDPELIQRIEAALEAEGVSFGTTAKAVFTPRLTIVLWLRQVLHHGSCSAVLLWLVDWSDLLDRARLDTGNYCRARAKIPTVVVASITRQTASKAEDEALLSWCWYGRPVSLLDGATITLPDTEENQKEFPQPVSQKKGLGFPLMRLVVLLSLATAMLLDLETGPCAGKETGETALFRKMLARLPASMIVVADRYFCSYFMIALAMEAGIDVVFRLHQRRDADFTKGKRLGEGDRLIVWQRPARPDWMSEEEYAEMPEKLTVRMIRGKVTQPGYRAKEITIVTTLTDAKAYRRDQLLELYHQRWQVELDIRSIKTTMQMEMLKTKTPEMCRSEVWMHALAYNLARQQAIKAALVGGCEPRDISLSDARKVAQNRCDKGLQKLAGGPRSRPVSEVVDYHLSKRRVRNRPGRCEPRAVKRRPKPHKLLTEPREVARAKLLRGEAAA
jgi:hypothetical protein